MKVCELCGDEISTKDGENRCTTCEELAQTKEAAGQPNVNQKRAARNRQRRERDQAMRDLGLVKVRGALGGTYYE